jgi:hypothetical protein
MANGKWLQNPFMHTNLSDQQKLQYWGKEDQATGKTRYKRDFFMNLIYCFLYQNFFDS